MAIVFTRALELIADGTIDWANDTDIRMILLKGAGTPVIGNATVTAALAESDVDEVDATGYARESVGTRSISVVSNQIRFLGGDVDFGDVGNGTNNDITGYLIYKGTTDPGDDATNVPIVYSERSGGALTTQGTNVTAKPGASGYFLLRQPS